jgi:sugar-specific transcriptional regulator TrmB
MTAKDLSKSSNVPIGRIYEVLEELETKKMIEINDSRPKTFSTVPLNRAIYNLIAHQTREDERRSSYLYEQAKVLETKLYSSNIRMKVEPSEIFYSTILEPKQILKTHINSIYESQEEALLSGFVNENSMKLLSIADKLLDGIDHALDRGVQVKSLMSFEFDDRPISENQKKDIEKLTNEIKDKFSEVGLSNNRDGYELKFTYKRFPNCYDIIDKERIIMKLQNPSASWQIFACLNIVDPPLAGELRKKYLNVWHFDCIS